MVLPRRLRHRYSEKGFTIIELVVVIVLLGILSAVALPRFINLTEDAHKASVQGTAGAFASAVMLVKTQALVKGKLGSTYSMTNGVWIRVNAKGYPISTDQNSDEVIPVNCRNLWYAVMSPAPSLTYDALDRTQDYYVTTSSKTCQFQYVPDRARSILYDTETGSVTVKVTP